MTYCSECKKELKLCQCKPESGIIIPDLPHEILVSFESGHYKKIVGHWKGDSIWGHYYKENGKMVQINLSKVEYLEEL